jgi:hypothetical protein
MKQILVTSALLASLTSLPAHATLYDFSYTYNKGVSVVGSLTGSLVGDYLTDVGNVHISVDGSPFYDYSFALAYSNNSWNNTIDPIVSPNVFLNNFLFVDSNFPSDTSYTKYFYVINSPSFGLQTAIYTSSVSTFDSSTNGSWSLSEHRVAAPIPEPETYAMMLAGLGVLGFMTRRKKSA